MSRSDIDKMFAEFPSPYLDEHEREVWRQQAIAYAASIEDWANKYFYYRFYPNGMAIPDTFEGFTQMLSELRQGKSRPSSNSPISATLCSP